MANQKGQVVLILVLVMTVALAIGISVVQRSLSDISTATKVEQSSRAFSAAEAGIEKAIQEVTQAQPNYSPVPSFNLDNNATVGGVDKNRVPATGQALEYSSLSKEELAQVWLANPNDLSSPYGGSTLDIYWGNTTDDRAALELTLIYYGTDSTDLVDGSTSKYRNRKWFLDQITRTPANNFDRSANCNGNHSTGSSSTTYQCYKQLSGLPASPSRLMLIRARLLYNTTSQPFAVKPTSGSLPQQATVFTSTGTSGGTQRKVRVFRLDKVVPPYFDYAIFSAGEINK